MKLMQYLRTRIQSWEFLQFGVLFLVLITLCFTVSDVVPGLQLNDLALVALVALVLGWLSAQVQLSTRWVLPILLVIGLVVLSAQFSGVVSLIIDRAEGIREFGSKASGWPFRGDLEWGILIDLKDEGVKSVTVLATRWWDWFQGLIQGQLTYDPIPIAISWNLAIWAIAAWSARLLRHHDRTFLAILPSLVLLVVLILSTGRSTSRLLLPGWMILFLSAITQQRKLETRWHLNKVDTPYWLGGELAIYAAVSALGIQSIALALPDWNPLDQLEQWRTSASGSEAIGEIEPGSTLSRRGPDILDLFEGFRAAGLPRRHLLGSGPELSEEWVFEIVVEDPLANTDFVLGNPRPYYWRQLTYDVYTGLGWSTSSVQQTEYSGGMPTDFENGESSRRIQQHVRSVKNVGGPVTASGELLTVNSDFTLAWRTPLDQFGAMTSAGGYRVQSMEATYDVDRLRAAGDQYPEWVINRFLPLPADLPDRVRQLAWQLTAAGETPYDRALAIESYLRGFPYSLEVAAPPIGSDVVEFFLFETEEGYCDYYASAMVVLARAAGIPARFVTGYITGSRIEGTDVYQVTEAEAHSWPEIYFPGVGFVRFEPTAGRPALFRETSLDRSLLPSSTGSDFEDADGMDQRLQQMLTLTLLLVGSGAVLWIGMKGWGLTSLLWGEPGAGITMAYRRLLLKWTRAGPEVDPSATPLELSGKMREWSSGGEKSWRSGFFSRGGQQELDRLVDAVIQHNFAGKDLNRGTQRDVVLDYLKLRLRFRVMDWISWIHERVMAWRGSDKG